MPYDSDESYKISELDDSETDNSTHSPSPKPLLNKQKSGFNISCDKCGKYFRYKWSLNLHYRHHENKVYVKCSQCPAKFNSFSDLKKHLVSHSTEKPFKCNFCPTYCKSRNLKLRHENTHDMTTYSCRYCEATFKRYILRVNHERSHKNKESEILNAEIGETQYKCLICFSLYSSPKFLKEHIKIKHVPTDKVETIDEENVDVKYKCKFCSEIFVDLCVLLKHINILHKVTITGSKIQPSKQSFKCSICLLKFKKHKELRMHAENMHPSDWKDLFFKMCPICNKYITPSYFPFHIMIHKGLRPFKCDKCEAKFPCKGDLRTHLKRSCNDKKKYQCHWCKEIVNSKQEIDAHRILHLGRKCFKCDKCDCAFYGSGQLYIHKFKIHVKKKKECYICKKQILSIFLKGHIKRYHEMNEKLCDHCGKTFLNDYKLKVHLRHVLQWQKFNDRNKYN